MSYFIRDMATAYYSGAVGTLAGMAAVGLVSGGWTVPAGLLVGGAAGWAADYVLQYGVMTADHFIKEHL